MSSRFREVFREGIVQAWRHPLRSGLSAVTCAVAIAVTVNVISLLYGLEADLSRDVQRFGRLTVDVVRLPVVLPGMKRETLGPAEAERAREALGSLPHRMAPTRIALGSARGDAEVPRIPLLSVAPGYPETLAIDRVAGEWFLPEDDPGAVCALDESAAALLFPGRSPGEVEGRSVVVEGPGGRSERRVVGILEDPLTYRALFEAFDEGARSRALTSGMLSFRNLYLPEGQLPGEEYSSISVAVRSEDDLDEAARRLRTIWPPASDDPLHNLQSVGVFVRRDWMDVFGGFAATGALVGNVVWIIVVLVAAIMISTLNLITVRERYDEIAVRRCEGARRGEIALQVTVEGTLIALVGGLAGLPLGSLGADVLRGIVELPFRFEGRYALLGTGVAVLLGLLSSVVPARRAARLDPAAVLSRRIT
jgi:hypothetical protein